MSNRTRRRKGKRVKPHVSLVRLEAMHADVKSYVRKGEHGPGSEAYSLLCALGACCGNWPEVRTEKVKELNRRFLRLLGFARAD
jgi:hypothetical protein